jgi:hypothetical protein
MGVRVGAVLAALLSGACSPSSTDGSSDLTPPPGATVTVRIQPNPVRLSPGDSAWLVADVQGVADRSVTWSIREGPAGGTINQTAYPVQYRSPPVEGVFHVVATSAADTTASDVATVITSWNVYDGGGRVAANVHAYAIWWGDPASFPPDEKNAVEAFLATVGGSSYLAVADQYLRGAKATVSFSASLLDPSDPPDGAGASSELNEEICGQIAASGQKPDPLGMYFVFTPSVPPGMTLCALHSWTTCEGTNVLYAFVPTPTNSAPCNYVQGLACNGLAVPTQSVVNHVAHELMETITDPFGDGWSNLGSEISDRCSAEFDHCVSLAGAQWQLQEQWSNAAHACVQE